jgi:hypothetical protein
MSAAGKCMHRSAVVSNYDTHSAMRALNGSLVNFHRVANIEEQHSGVLLRPNPLITS